MDKYYLARLAGLPGGVSARQGAKFVEINYSRRPPTFGIVYLTKDRKSINLNCLEFSGSQNETDFSHINQIDLLCEQFASPGAIDFDTNDSIITLKDNDDSPSTYQSPSGERGDNFQPQCVVLLERGILLQVNFNSVQNCVESFKIDKTTQSNMGRESFVQCKLECYEETNFRIHLLSKRGYFLFESERARNSLSLVNSYRLNSIKATAFTRFHLLASRPEVVLELNDSSLEILRNFKCIANIDTLGDNSSIPRDLFVLSDARNSNELLVIAYKDTNLSAFNLLIPDPISSDKDPDRILLKEPSFEFEPAWSIDLNDIDCIRASNENDDHDNEKNAAFLFAADSNPYGCLTIMRSPNQIVCGSDLKKWPKFLIVTYRYYVLIYGFQQEVNLPFSVVYDKLFLKFVSPPDETKGRSVRENKLEECVDVKQRPKLMQNFKLIGSQPNDSLFNTLFLVSQTNLIQCRIFPQLGLIICLTNLADVLALKLISKKLIDNKDGAYQQLIVDSLASANVLREQISSLNQVNFKLKQNLENLENHLKMVKREDFSSDFNFTKLEEFLNAHLVAEENLPGLYNLQINFSNLIQVERIVIISEVNCNFLNPVENPAIENCEINNNNYFSTTFQYSVVMELNEKRFSGSSNNSITIPVFINDGQLGQLKVFYLLRNKPSPLDQSLNRLELFRPQHGPLEFDSGNSETVTIGYYLNTVQIAPLMSYQATHREPLAQEHPCEIKIVGSFSSKMMIQWVRENFNPGVFEDGIESMSGADLYSPFTRCNFHFSLRDNELTLRSCDIISLELVKKNLLKKATDSSLELSLTNSMPSLAQLKYILSKQYLNLTSFKLNDATNTSYAEVQNKIKNDTDLLLDGLLNEAHLDQFSGIHSYTPNQLREALRKDVESTLASNQPRSISKKALDQVSSIYKDLIIGSILDTLIDFDKLNSLSRSINESRICDLRLKLLEIVDAELSPEPKPKDRFVDEILNCWNQLKQL